MTCESVTVEYPSSKLLALVNDAIINQTTEKKLLEKEQQQREDYFKSLPWYKKWRSPSDWQDLNYWNYCTQHSDVTESLRELNKIRLVAEISEVVRISGDCLARIDKWAGNQWNR